MLLDRLFVIYRDSVDDSMSGPPVPLAVLEVLDFNEKLLGCTQVVRVDPHYVWSARHPEKAEPVERLVGRTYNCLGQACQRVYAAYHGTAVRTEFMNRFEVYLRSSEIDPALLGEISYERLSRGVRLTEWCSPALAAARVESLEIPPLVTPQPARPGDPWEGWIPVGSGRPYVHSGTPHYEVEQLQREARRVALEVPSARSQPTRTHRHLTGCRTRLGRRGASSHASGPATRTSAPTPRRTRSRRASCAGRSAATPSRRWSPAGWSSSRTTCARAAPPTRRTRTSW